MTNAARRIVLATTNEHKVHELRQILAELVAELDLEIVSAADFADLPDVAETEITFHGNAGLKARAIAAATGLPALADDSGLTVMAMGEAPGVFSARWAGSRAGAGAARAEKDRANLELLLEQLADVPDGSSRSARFRCAAAIALPDGELRHVERDMPGHIAREPRGSNGFGYDPIFVPTDQPEGERRHLAEFTDAEKNAISHRGRAFRDLAPLIRDLLTT